MQNNLETKVGIRVPESGSQLSECPKHWQGRQEEKEPLLGGSLLYPPAQDSQN